MKKTIYVHVFNVYKSIKRVAWVESDVIQSGEIENEPAITWKLIHLYVRYMQHRFWRSFIVFFFFGSRTGILYWHHYIVYTELTECNYIFLFFISKQTWKDFWILNIASNQIYQISNTPSRFDNINMMIIRSR